MNEGKFHRDLPVKLTDDRRELYGKLLANKVNEHTLLAEQKKAAAAAYAPKLKANSLEQSRLRPWIFLAVLKEDEFVEQKASGPLQAFEIKEGLDLAAIFPDEETRRRPGFRLDEWRSQQWRYIELRQAREAESRTASTEADGGG